ncbi:uncharacterized protein B0I36DRAFT_314982 [Microdochium trichocladiopsis]|uniref:Uncharacterized protein n=1 Tax=Microdochium trichocladiopsis TaxID=1682393 RepID=A0A9P9BYA6_9PEZI|nr:uncharacterized protein B0I36DRAFT_314982 [Microdochium trichocladiopsis]KAH7037873.1 hypothetical protein B0I36DRAFT_314982 [Microdochium trichocladiopsis]
MIARVLLCRRGMHFASSTLLSTAEHETMPDVARFSVYIYHAARKAIKLRPGCLSPDPRSKETMSRWADSRELCIRARPLPRYSWDQQRSGPLVLAVCFAFANIPGRLEKKILRAPFSRARFLRTRKWHESGCPAPKPMDQLIHNAGCARGRLSPATDEAQAGHGTSKHYHG